MTLADAPARTPLTITSMAIEPALHRRLTEFGVRHGACIEVVRRAPFGGPLALRVAGGLLALRRDQARQVDVEVEGARG